MHTVITHNIGHSEVIERHHLPGQRSIAKYQLIADGRTYPEWIKRHDAIVQKLYRINTNKVVRYLESLDDIKIL